VDLRLARLDELLNQRQVEIIGYVAGDAVCEFDEVRRDLSRKS
jgi:hypothetical protein